MKYGEFFKNLKNGDISSVYLFVGEERFVAQSALRQLIENAVDENLKDVNLLRLSATATGEEIASACETVPFSSGKRAVIVEESGFLQKSSPDGEERLAEYLENPQSDTVLVFFSPQADKRKKIYKMLQKHTVVEFDALTDSELVAWCTKELKKRGVEADRNTVAFLCEYAEPEPESMINEIEKLASYKLSGGALTREDIVKIVIPYGEYGVFRMTDALANGEIKTAMEFLDGMLTQKEDVFYILGAVAKQYRQLLRIKVMASEGKTKQSIISELGLREFVYNKYLSLCRNYGEKQLRRAVELCAMCDAGLKTGGSNTETALYELAANIAELRRKRS